MSSDTPPSIPPRKKSGTDQKKPAAKPKPAGQSATGSAAAASKPAASGSSSSKPTSSGSGDSTSTASSTTSAAAAKPAAATDAATSTAAAGAVTLTATETEEKPAREPRKPREPRTAREPRSSRGAQTARPAEGTPGGPRRVRLAVSRIDPWSVMKLSFLVSFAAGIMLVVATVVLWMTLDGLQIFAKINDLAVEILAESDFDLLQYVELSRVTSVAALIAIVDVFLITALSTIFAFLYNITAALVGGVHLTLTDD